MTRSSFSEVDCGVAQAVDQLGDKWTLLILRSAFHGIRRFDDFLEHLGIAGNILSDRLRRLVEADLLYRRHDPKDRRAVEYRLTEKALDAYPLIVFLNQWGERWLGKPGGSRVDIVDKTSRNAVQDIKVLSTDGRVLGARDTEMREGPGKSSVLARSREILARRSSN